MSDDPRIEPQRDELPLDVRVVLLDPSLGLPSYAYEGDAGIDLVARIDVTVSATTGAAVVPTGISLAIPPGYVGMICPRSGLASSQGISVLNAPGIIDSSYRGEIAVVLFSIFKRAFTIRRGDRIAQLVVQPAVTCRLVPSDTLDGTSRGSAGLGSTDPPRGQAD